MTLFTILEDATAASAKFTADYFGNFIAALLILFGGIFVGRFIDRAVRKGLAQIELNKIIYKVIITESDFERLIAKLISYLIYFLAVVLFLVKIGVVTTLFWVVVVVFGLFIIISVLLQIRDIIPNYIAGYMLKDKKLKVGDSVEIDGVKGKIKRFTITDVVIETRDKHLMHFPNRKLKNEYKVKKVKKKKK